MAERLLRASLRETTSPGTDPLFAFASAGVRTRDGFPMDPISARLTQEYGGDPSGHLSSALTKTVAGDADLLLGMTRDHVIDASRRFPALLLRGFTLIEFARVLPFVMSELPLPSVEDPAARLRAVVRLAAANRGRAPSSEGSDDIEDPIGRSEATHARVAEQIAAAVADISRDLRALARQ